MGKCLFYLQTTGFDLHIGKRFAQGVDGAAGHGFVFKQGDPVGGGLGAGDGVHRRNQLGAVQVAGFGRGEAHVSGPLGLTGGMREAAELAVVANGQQNLAVLRVEVLVRGQAGVGVALALRHGAGVEVADGLVRQQGHAHIQQRHVDVLATAGAVAHLQRCQYRAAGKHARAQVGDGHAHAHGAAAGCAIGIASDAHHAAHGLDHQVIAGAWRVRAGLAKAGHAAVNQPGVQGRQAGVIQPIVRQPADLEVLHQDVALRGHLLDDGLAFGFGHIHRDGALVAIGGVEVSGVGGGVAVGIGHERRAPFAGVIAVAGALDFDDVSAQIGQHLRAVGACQHSG